MILYTVIPCYNEEKRLNFQAFQDFFARKEDAGKVMFLFVDDGSRDGTTAFLKTIIRLRAGSISLSRDV